MNVSIVKTQITREIWEHKTGLIYSPLIATLLFLILFIYGLISMSSFVAGDKIPFQGNIDLHGPSGTAYHIDGKDGDATQLTSLIDNIRAGEGDTLNLIFTSIVAINFGLLLVIAAVVLMVYNHSCLFDDRKNRDILFWRSMPVSETTNVLVKLGILLLYFPLTALLLNLIVTIVAIIATGLCLIFKGVSIGSWLVAVIKSGALLVSFKLFVASLVCFLALVPFIGFVLLASAFAKKSPFLTATLVPIGILILDKLLQSYFGINLHFIDVLDGYVAFLAEVADFFDVTKDMQAYGLLVPKLFQAIAVGGLFVVGAIWLRNNRYEI